MTNIFNKIRVHNDRQILQVLVCLLLIWPVSSSQELLLRQKSPQPYYVIYSYFAFYPRITEIFGEDLAKYVF